MITAVLVPGKKHEISNRERTMLALAAEGLTNAEIAERMGYARKTVETSFYSIYELLEARNRTHAVVKALQLGFLRLE